jgi:hypothetical protein
MRLYAYSQASSQHPACRIRPFESHKGHGRGRSLTLRPRLSETGKEQGGDRGTPSFAVAAESSQKTAPQSRDTEKNDQSVVGPGTFTFSGEDTLGSNDLFLLCVLSASVLHLLFLGSTRVRRVAGYMRPPSRRVGHGCRPLRTKKNRTPGIRFFGNHRVQATLSSASLASRLVSTNTNRGLLSASISTVTLPPPANLPNNNSSANARRIVS